MAENPEVDLTKLLNLYADRDHAEQGDWYLRHVVAMAEEGLHEKSAIAGELAARDSEIDRLKGKLIESAETYEDLRREVERCFDIAQRLDVANNTLPKAFTGVPSERITRQVHWLQEQAEKPSKLPKAYEFLRDYEPGQWWETPLEEMLCGRVTDDGRRSIAVLRTLLSKLFIAHTGTPRGTE